MRFGWIFISYIIWISVLTLSNSASSIANKPVLALGFISKWWFVILVFLFSYISEWLSILKGTE